MSQLDITKQYLLPVKSTSQINLPTTNDVVYLKISISVNNINSNIPATGTIIDRNNWSVQANSEYDIENTASMMLDGDNRTGWLAGSGENATVILDMGQSNMLKGFQSFLHISMDRILYSLQVSWYIRAMMALTGPDRVSMKMIELREAILRIHIQGG